SCVPRMTLLQPEWRQCGSPWQLLWDGCWLKEVQRDERMVQLMVRSRGSLKPSVPMRSPRSSCFRLARFDIAEAKTSKHCATILRSHARPLSGMCTTALELNSSQSKLDRLLSIVRQPL